MKNNILYSIVIGVIIFLAVVYFARIKIQKLQYECKNYKSQLNEMDKKCAHYSNSFNKLIATNIFDNVILSDTIKIGIKINDYGCDVCSRKILGCLKKHFDQKNILIVLNANSSDLINILNINDYSILIDTMQSYNFKSIEPVVFIANNNKYLFPFSPDIVFAPELFESYIDKAEILINNH